MYRATGVFHCPLWVKRDRFLILCLRDHPDLSIYWPTGRCKWFGLLSPSYATISNCFSLGEKNNDAIDLSAVGTNLPNDRQESCSRFHLGCSTKPWVSPWKRQQWALRHPPRCLTSRSKPFPKEGSTQETRPLARPGKQLFHLLKKKLKVTQNVIFLRGLPASKIMLL